MRCRRVQLVVQVCASAVQEFCRVDRGIVHVLRMGNVCIVCREIGVQRFVARDEMQDAWFVVSALWFSLGL